MTQIKLKLYVTKVEYFYKNIRLLGMAIRHKICGFWIWFLRILIVADLPADCGFNSFLFMDTNKPPAFAKNIF